MRKMSSVATLTLIMAIENILIWLAGTSFVAANVAFAAAFTFYTMSISPKSLFGFAFTIREWSDIFSRGLLNRDPLDASEFAKAAARSLVVLSACVLLEFCIAVVRSGERSLMKEFSVLTGIEAGVVAGYLIVARQRSSR